MNEPEEIRDIGSPSPAAPQSPLPASARAEPAGPVAMPSLRDPPPGVFGELCFWLAEWSLGTAAFAATILSAVGWAANAPGSIGGSLWSSLLSLSNSGPNALFPLSGAAFTCAPLWLFIRPMRSMAPTSSRHAKLSCMAWAALGACLCQWIGICILDLRQDALSPSGWIGLAALPPLAWACFSRMEAARRRLRSAEPKNPGLFPGSGRASAFFALMFVFWCATATLDAPPRVWQSQGLASKDASSQALDLAESDEADRQRQERATALSWETRGASEQSNRSKKGKP